MYALGIDLGTTYTAAATWQDGRVEIASLGSRGTSIPSVVLLRADETFLTGETASRRALTEPQRVAREFKRRLGDPTPILLGGVPYSAEALMARLLRWVVDEVAAREGGEPSQICVCHPANWGPYKMDLLRQAVRMTNLEQPVSFTTEPEAAAVFYAQGRPVPPGALVAVYDLGGGTFDAAVLRKTESGFAILGQPEGIERLGGIDFDAAVFSHVNRAIGDKLAELDEGDPAAVAAVARLRDECVAAKEALSSDTDVSIPVLLPNLATEVRLTRAELEAMVRPALFESIGALRRALRSAAVTPEQLHAVLLVGGSSRMPIVAQLVGAELARPVAVDAHPKHAIALGAAWVASGSASAAREARVAPVAPPPPPPVEHERPPPPAVSPPVVVPPPPVDREPPAAHRMPPAGHEPPPPREREPVLAAGGPDDTAPTVVIGGQGSGPPTNDGSGRNLRTPLLVAGSTLAAVAIAAVAVLQLGGNDGNPGGTGQTNSPDVTGQTSPTVTQSESDSPSATDTTTELPLDEQCTEEIMANPRWVCITSATIVDENLVIEYDADFGGDTPNKSSGFHVHFYGADESGTEPPDEIMGSHASNPGDWYIEDQEPSIKALTSNEVAALNGMPKVCARIAQGQHELVSAESGTFHTGNCAPILSG